MSQAFFWTLGLALTMVVLLEGSSVFSRGSSLHRVSTGGMILLVVGIILAAFRLMLLHQSPSFSLALPTFFLGFSS